jgi:hypothetical protein
MVVNVRLSLSDVEITQCRCLNPVVRVCCCVPASSTPQPVFHDSSLGMSTPPGISTWGSPKDCTEETQTQLETEGRTVEATSHAAIPGVQRLIF